MSIRIKVILPYLLLTLVVAAAGAYLLTRIVSDQLSERLTNQLLESGRVVMDEFVRKEVAQVEAARLIAFTQGLPEALANGEQRDVENLATPAAGGLGVESLIIVDFQRREMLNLLLQGGVYRSFPRGEFWGQVAMVQELLGSNEAQPLPRRDLIQNAADGDQYYYYTAYPVILDQKVVGVVLAGTSTKTMLPSLRNVSLSDVVLYNRDCRAIGTSSSPLQADPVFLRNQQLSPDLCAQVRESQGIVDGENIFIENRGYRLAYKRLLIAEDNFGVFAVFLPMDFVIQPASLNRDTSVLLMAISMLAVVGIGYGVSRVIINPLFALVRTSEAIAAGDLTKRTGIKSRDEIGTLANSFDVMTDNLQQRTLELERANAALAKIDKTKSDFIQIAAHELRTPLTLLSGYSQILTAKAGANADLEPLAKGMNEGSARMLEVVNSMLDISRIDSNTLKILPEDTRLETVMNKVQRTFKHAWGERKLTLVTNGLAEMPPVYVDPDLMYKMLYHLVMNAIKYTPDGGKITVSAHIMENPREVEILVCDTGIGINQADHQLIFEKFYQTGEVQVHSSGRTKFKGGGPGLGLAIVRGVVEAHGGRVWVESLGHDEVNCPGSCFIVRIPLKQGKPA